MPVILKEEFDPLGDWHGDFNYLGAGKFLPESGGKIDASYPVGLGFRENWLSQVQPAQGFMQATLKPSLGRLNPG